MTMAFETMRRPPIPWEPEEVTGGSNTLLEDFEAAMEKKPKSVPLSPDEWLRWELAEPGTAKPLDPRASVNFLDGLEGKQAPADVLPSLAPAGPGITSEMRAEAKAANSLMAARKEGLPPSGADRDSLQKLMSPGSLVSPIPTATASVRTDAPEAVKKTIAATTPERPAPPAGTKPEAGSGGDDDVRNLYLARLIAQNAAGFGGMGAGKNIDMGIADTLGERMKQIEALRAKREDQTLEQQRERSTWGASNRATLASALAQWKGDPEKTAALEALASGADTTKPGDFSRNTVNAVMTKPKVLGAEAGVGKTVAATNVANANAVAVPAKVEQGAGKLAETIRSNRANEDIRRQALLVKRASDTKANNDVRAAGKDAAAAEKAITRAMETAEGDKLGIAGNIRDFQGLEAVAPGFTKGMVPDWLPQGGIAAARKVPGLEQRTAALSSALETFIAGIRKSLFGASLTGNEKESFDAIVSSGLLMPPDVLAANINRIRQGAARFAQNHFTVAQELHSEVTGNVLRASALFGPALSEGGIYSDVWKLLKTPAAGGVPAGMVKVKHSNGSTTTVNRATADRMLKDDPANFSEVK